MIGDLNDLSGSQDKTATHKGNSTKFDKFKKLVLSENSLLDIGFVGLLYTWWTVELTYM